MKKHLIVISVGLFLLCLSACTFGVDIADNCEKNQKKTIAVLPLIDDNYNCVNDIENILINKCYNLYDGKTLANECSFALNKGYEDISMDEFIDFAAEHNIDLIVYGTVSVEWTDGPRSIARPTDESKHNNSYEIDRIIEGNYAVIDCYCISTLSKEQNKMFNKFRLKRVPLGSPDGIWTMPIF